VNGKNNHEKIIKDLAMMLLRLAPEMFANVIMSLVSRFVVGWKIQSWHQR
jgi:hypothetical protein